jgi:hypothetical protein
VSIHIASAPRNKKGLPAGSLFFINVDPRRFELPASSVQMKRSTK